MSTAALSSPIPTDLVASKARISSIDVVRGLVMIIMALDHARDFFHIGAFNYDPTNLETTTPAIFFTRWITHFCAPTFVMLAGTSIYINSQKKGKKDLSMFLLTRGIWLIILEIVVIRFSFFFNLYYDITILQVIWVIGASMICMAGLIHLNYKIILGIGLLILFGHNTTDTLTVTPESSLFGIWTFLLDGGFLALTEGKNIFVVYPLIPWLGIMLLGFCLGRLYAKDYVPKTRQTMLIRIGIIAIALFMLIRFINIYGNPRPWAEQNSSLFTVISFLNCEKYPPSLLYTLMTLGPILILLAMLEKIQLPKRLIQPLVVFGRVPLFYYVLHFFLIHLISLGLFMNKTGKSFSELDFHFNNGFGGITSEGGYSLTITYLLWMAVVVALYPLCAWYNRYKSTHGHWWLSYL